MRIKLFLLIALMFTSLSCDDNLGTLDFEQNQEKEFAVFLPNIGTFDFKQQFATTSSSGGITTLLKVNSTNYINGSIRYEIINFKDATRSFENIEFITNDEIPFNTGDYTELFDGSGVLLDTDNTYISVIELPNNQNDLAGRYEGTGQIVTISTQDTIIKPVFNIYGNINTNNQILLLPLENTPEFKSLTGTYLATGEFTGTSINGETMGSVDNIGSEAFMLTNSQLSDTLNLTINNETKKLVLQLTQQQ
ncbi:hypothetical protein [Aquimarina litoralis]|uniref:hypothetical protein n=1 Tax=Aquimarina litoralis TaxID=584605 RepID=UPI001C55C765|nr:hypothetical protein [Aquimarina litoralis]MBW1297014.1 hypothetical protein [Aquimarina litoralis]